MRCAQTQKAHMYAVAREATKAMVLFAEVNLGVSSEMLCLQTHLHLIQFYTQWNKWPMFHLFLYQVHFLKLFNLLLKIIFYVSLRANKKWEAFFVTYLYIPWG